MSRRASLIAVALAAAVPHSVFAQFPRDTLPAVVVTATRVPISTVAPTATATVLRGEDLRAQGITRVLDALRQVPGAEVVASGPAGSLTSLFLRGGNSSYVRVLIDGVAVNDAGGAFDFSTLTTDNIDRIEIVRGPASVLYGSDAVTGVIQLFTRDGRGTFSTGALVGAGTQGTARGELSASGGNAHAGFSLGAAHQATDGILAFNNRFVNDVLSALVRFAPDAHTDARIAARWTASTYHYPTDYTGAVVDHNAEQNDHRLVASLDAGHRFTDRVEVRVNALSNEYLPRSNDDKDSPADTLGFYGYFSRAVRTRRSADARVNLRLATRGVLTVGGETAYDREASSSLSLSQYGKSAGGFEAARHNGALYAQAVGDASSRIAYAIGARVDDNSAFGTFRTVRASAAFVVSAASRVRLSVGNAFKAPSFYENFATGYVKGNPALLPEQSRGVEIGFDTFLDDGNVVLKATGYVQRFRDVIQYTGTAPSPGAPNYFNVAGADANGAELEAEYRGFNRWTLAGNYSWSDTRVTQAGFDKGTGASYVRGEKLIRRAPHTASVSVVRLFGDGATVRFSGTRIGARDDRDFAAYPAAAVTLPAYVKVDASAVVPLPAKVRGGLAITARADNLFGANYEEIARFAAPGRVVFVGVRFGK